MPLIETGSDSRMHTSGANTQYHANGTGMRSARPVAQIAAKTSSWNSSEIAKARSGTDGRREYAETDARKRSATSPALAPARPGRRRSVARRSPCPKTTSAKIPAKARKKATGTSSHGQCSRGTNRRPASGKTNPSSDIARKPESRSMKTDAVPRTALPLFAPMSAMR